MVRVHDAHAQNVLRNVAQHLISNTSEIGHDDIWSRFSHHLQDPLNSVLEESAPFILEVHRNSGAFEIGCEWMAILQAQHLDRDFSTNQFAREIAQKCRRPAPGNAATHDGNCERFVRRG
jgi:hypothetical protein